MNKAEVRAHEYRTRAEEASLSIDDATLDRVREQRRASAATWTAMADAADARASEMTDRAAPQ
jgi:hypothetical protein